MADAAPPLPAALPDAALGFLAAAGWPAEGAVPLAGDASQRRYLRLSARGESAILMLDAPGAAASTERFVTVAAHLRGLGLSAPRILAQDTRLGLLLLEDFGDGLFSTLANGDTAREERLYSTAIDVLVRLHAEPAPAWASAPAAADLAAATGPAFDWYLAAAAAHDAAARAGFIEAFTAALSPLDEAPRTLAHRDYHAANLVWLPARRGVARAGLLDFQDAFGGHPAYDLVSLLTDARRDIRPALARTMTARYIAATGADEERFMLESSLLSVQRNLRILGVFARLCLRDGRARYLAFMPRVWGHLQAGLAHPGLAALRAPLACLPPPGPALLERFEKRCPISPAR